MVEFSKDYWKPLEGEKFFKFVRHKKKAEPKGRVSGRRSISVKDKPYKEPKHPAYEKGTEKTKPIPNRFWKPL